MHGIFAVAVYQASLTLWCFAIVTASENKYTNALSMAWTTFSDPPKSIAKLDGQHDSRVKDFIALNRGAAALSGSHCTGSQDEESTDATILVLYNPAALMHAGTTILRRYSQGQKREADLPRFVASLVQLMDDLGLAAKSVGFG
jgi:hypothetical protein